MSEQDETLDVQIFAILKASFPTAPAASKAMALERVLRPIVEGQVRSFVHDHPEVLDAVDWYKGRADRKLTFVNSVAKRILRDLLCSETRVRLVQALACEGALSSPATHRGLEFLDEPTPAASQSQGAAGATAMTQHSARPHKITPSVKPCSILDVARVRVSHGRDDAPRTALAEAPGAQGEED